MQKVGQNAVCDTGDVSPGQFSDHKQGESDLLIRLRLPSRSGDGGRSADGDYNDVNMRGRVIVSRAGNEPLRSLKVHNH